MSEAVALAGAYIMITAASVLWYLLGVHSGRKWERLKWERAIADLERQTGHPLYDQLRVSFDANMDPMFSDLPSQADIVRKWKWKGDQEDES